MKEEFIAKKFSARSLELIGICNDIITDYQGQGLRLTLRQLYYQLVTRNEIENKERSYKNLSSLVSDARLAGEIDWSAIEDRVRKPRTQTEFENIKELIDCALRSWRLPRWRGQKTYVELWVEKDALAGVLEPIANDMHVTMMVNRGYSSQSAMYEAANRLTVNAEDKECVVLYLGDHDPSGEDMVRDIRERLIMFTHNENLIVKKIALNMSQVQQYNPPPNPAKLTDPRAQEYVQRFGSSSWEVDALPPEILTRLIKSEINQFIDKRELRKVMNNEGMDKDKLLEATESIR